MADETLVYTILGEARGEGVEGMVGVANVIHNRATSGLYPADPVDVVLQPWQFSTNNTEANGGNQAATRREVPVGSDLYNQAARIVDLYIEGDNPPTDLTGGSLFYHTTGLDWRYADSVTTRYGTTTIGGHTFYPRQPLPQIDIGSVDLLAGGAPAAPSPMARSARPGGYTQTTAQQILEIQSEQRYARRQAVIAAQMREAMGSATVGDLGDGARSVTGRLPFEGDFTDPNDPILNSITPERARLMSRGVAMDVSSAQARDDVMIGGLGSLLGRAFPMGPTAADRVVTQAPSTAELFDNKPAPGLRLPVAPDAPAAASPAKPVAAVQPDWTKRTPLVPTGGNALRAGDSVADSGLIRRAVQTIKIDPFTGMPAVVVAEKATTPPSWTSMGGSPFMTFNERVKFAQEYQPAIDAKRAGLTAPGANITREQRDAISGSGAPIPRPAGARDTAPPVPMPASARPKVSTLAPLPKPEPLTFQTQKNAATVADLFGNKPVPGLRLPTAVQSSTPAPAAVISRPATTTVTRTVVVRTDGTQVAVPRAGSVQMPADARPSVVTKPPVDGLRLPVAPVVSTSTVKPQQAVLSAPGAGLTAAQRAAISGSGAPIPAVKPTTLASPPPATTVNTRTVTVTTRVAVPARVAATSEAKATPAASTIPKGYVDLGGGKIMSPETGGIYYTRNL